MLLVLVFVSFFGTVDTCLDLRPANIAFVLDGSSSIGNYQFGVMQEFVNTMIRDWLSVGVAHRLGVVTYSKVASSPIPIFFYDPLPPVYAAVSAMSPLLKGTKPDVGLYEVQNMIDSILLSEPPGEFKLNISILISDWYWPKGCKDRIFKAADHAKAFNLSQVVLMHIGTVDPNMYMEDTATLSPVTSNRYFIKINSMDELPTIIPLLMAFLCEYAGCKTSFIYISIGTVPQIS